MFYNKQLTSMNCISIVFRFNSFPRQYYVTLSYVDDIENQRRNPKLCTALEYLQLGFGLGHFLETFRTAGELIDYCY